MFNNFHQLLFLKKKLKKKKIPLIEDNSIYFDNFKSGKLKRFSGYLGDYTILSFNIMKNISAFYGGAVAKKIRFLPISDYNFQNFLNSKR
jgi:dTDP-4-amino-4,6-dideoxygalactose transaminase